jgi:multiple sugar transport system permease protein
VTNMSWPQAQALMAAGKVRDVDRRERAHRRARELEESAKVEGCSLQGAFARILLPISGQGIVTAIALSFVFSWKNFMFSLVLSSRRTETLPIAIYNFVSYAEVSWGSVMAAAVVIIAPAIVLTMFFQKYVIKGLTMGAVKG